MIITRNIETSQYVATQTSPKEDGVTRYSLEAYGETASEAINKCLNKWFGVVSTEQRYDDMDDDSDDYVEDNGNLPPGTDQRDLDFRNF